MRLRSGDLVLLRCSPWSTRRHFNTSGLRNPFKILFLGRDEFSCAVFEELHRSRDVWETLVVATNPDTYLGHSPLRPLAQSLQVPVHFIPPEKSRFKYWEPPSPFSVTSPDHVMITASFGRILTPAQLDLFPPAGRLNVHGSLLPAYRGPAPIQRAILNDETRTGVSIAQMLKRGVDKGPIWGTADIPISPDATFTSLRSDLADLGGRLLVTVLRDMLAGTAKSNPQPPESPTQHARSIAAVDAILDFPTMTAEDIVTRHRAIGHQRALTTWMPSVTRLLIYDPVVAHPSFIPPKLSGVPGALMYHKPTRTLAIRCALGTVLTVPRVKKERRSMLEAREFWNGVVPNSALLVRGELRLVRLEEAALELGGSDK